MMGTSVFEKIGLRARPVFLAPLAGVSDHPFRRICAEQGADLTYVEMISATALVYNSARTIEMLKRHGAERLLGVQITGSSAEETARGIAILNEFPFETVDINMGCPVKKVVKTGCGSAILKDPERVRRTLELARAATDRPVSCKIRLGWDHASLNGVEVAQAAAAGGAAWITVHGRTRADDYSAPVALDGIAAIKRAVTVPVIGNGNLFDLSDGAVMARIAAIDGWMVSRGALGNPWVFRQMQGDTRSVSLIEWEATVLRHLAYQAEEYGEVGSAAICMRKHLLWYASGWPGARKLREQINQTATMVAAREMIVAFVSELSAQGITERIVGHTVDAATTTRFQWDPKWEMDRRLDRGVGADQGCEGSEGNGVS